MSWVGRSKRRIEDPPLLRGQGRFVANFATTALAVRFVRSPVASGIIQDIDIPQGIRCITAKDITSLMPIRPHLHRKDYVPIEQPILAAQRVCFVGEPIAAVIASTQEQAEDHAEQVFIDIEPTPAIIDMEKALAPGAALVHEHAAANTIIDARMKTSGFEDAFNRAAKIVELDIQSRRQAAMPLETRGACASYDPSTGRITLIVSAQMPHILRTGLADILNIPETELRVVVPDVGGAFGQKMSLVPEYAVVAWLSRHTGSAIAWIEDRRDNLISSFHSRDQQHRVRGAFDENARLLAVEADIICNIGAYSCFPVTCGVEPLMAMAEFPGPYDFQEYSVRSRGVCTNTCPMAPYRGVSRPAITLAMERLMDCAADQFKRSKVEIRKINLIDSFPYKTAAGLTYDKGSYRESLEKAEQIIDLEAFREKQKQCRTEDRLLGIGFSVFNERTGYGTPAFAARNMEITPGYERVEISMDPSGFVSANIGASPHGQGLSTSLSQLIADEMGMRPNQIRIIHGDTDRTPYGWGTFASRSMVICGGACKLAANKLRAKLELLASEFFQVSVQEISCADGRFVVKDQDQVLDMCELARATYHSSHKFRSDCSLSARAEYDPGGTFSNACHVAEVEIDKETGLVTISRFLVVEDAGRLINPMIVDGQIHGGVTQGIANALLEEIIYDEDGNILTSSLMDFLVPTCAEIPNIEIYHLETITDASITGAKGMGEGGTIGAPAAIINAISDALSPFNIGLYEMPVTPQRIRQLIRAHEGA